MEGPGAVARCLYLSSDKSIYHGLSRAHYARLGDAMDRRDDSLNASSLCSTVCCGAEYERLVSDLRLVAASVAQGASASC
jgi:hypothetical protein